MRVLFTAVERRPALHGIEDIVLVVGHEPFVGFLSGFLYYADTLEFGVEGTRVPLLSDAGRSCYPLALRRAIDTLKKVFLLRFIYYLL